ncbi:MAG: copper homeostasis protein CutC [Caldilinea sp.]
MSILLEIIATSAEDCPVIERAGGDRIELCAALALGGLTPSTGLVQRARAATKLPIMMMLRPREGGFCYSPEEYRQMALDLKFGLAAGVDGFVFGFLNRDGTIDGRRTAHLVKLAGAKQSVFHRAFDVTPDPMAALETLIELGVTRILTSGQQPTALEGADLIRQLVVQANGRIEILPGAGVRADHVADLMQRTGVTQVHASASGVQVDPSTAANAGLRFGGAPAANGEGHRVADPVQISALKKGIEGLGR